MALENAEIAEILDEIASLLEIDEASPFRIRAYRNAADSLRFFDPPLVAMVESGADLTELQDVGAGIAKKIEEIVGLGRDAYREKMAAETSPGLLGLLRISGLGPKRVRVLRDELGVTSVEDLARAALDGRLRTVSGFGEKTVERLKKRLKISGEESA